FITEEIWQALPTSEGSVMIAAYPQWSEELDFPEQEAEFDKQIERLKDERAKAQAKEDREKELLRLEKELAKTKSDIEFISAKLANENFVAKAPPAQVENERLKLAKAQERLAEIESLRRTT
ncbi:MAG: hypothetical protein FWD35_05500, partial [Oscillospiraceae bacterium]|nr:hypothetical protein [Oscillospiraceae bacterium]